MKGSITIEMSENNGFIVTVNKSPSNRTVSENTIRVTGREVYTASAIDEAITIARDQLSLMTS